MLCWSGECENARRSGGVGNTLEDDDDMAGADCWTSVDVVVWSSSHSPSASGVRW